MRTDDGAPLSRFRRDTHTDRVQQNTRKKERKKKSPPAKSKEADASRSRSNNQQPNDIIILQVEFISVLLLPLLKEMPFSLSFFIQRKKKYFIFLFKKKNKRLDAMVNAMNMHIGDQKTLFAVGFDL